ncbi:MAG: hypothetical protein B7Y39_14055 [Bdellovibrio sp. 28-41-41]|nr:MAG: hypothetical protein B7Y39_14055 [Bdellovibrio sp. 28-41-41]
MIKFNYNDAFSRNIGWLTIAEQQKLRTSRVAIAGMGGVGGVHLLALTRLGIGKFNISDLDSFDVVNFNRQAGANINTVGKEKVQVMAQEALAINPDLDVRIFFSGVTENNIDDFFKDVDIYVDGLDLFAFKARELVYKTCAQKKIPIVVAVPLGFGTACISFLPGGITADQYFGFSKTTDDLEKAFMFLIGVSPQVLHRHYIADASAVNLKERRGPSTASACQLCAGVASTEAVKILLKRENIKCAPYSFQFDAYSYKLARSWRPWGYNNPFQRISLVIMKMIYKGMKSQK